MTVHDVTLTRTQRNDVFGWLTAARFSPDEFEWTEIREREVVRRGVVLFNSSVLTHQKTGYYFRFGGIFSRFSPGLEHKSDIEEHEGDWTVKANAFQIWLHRLRQEIDAPDLWASIGQEKALPTAAASANLDNLLFTPDEQRLVAAKLE